MAGSIGIKQANGVFYTIMEENSTEKKRLVLTTVHNSQKSVQIDLFRSLTKSMDDAMYIGSIVMDNLSPKPKGEPSIELTLSSSQDGSILADTVDLGNPENEHHLSVSLASFEEDKNEYSDFDFESESEPETPQKRRTEPIAINRKFPWLVIVIIGVVLTLLCLGLWFFLFRNKNAEKAAISLTNEAVFPITEPSLFSQPEQREPIVIENPPLPQSQPPARQRPTEPVYSYSVPQLIPPEGIAYKIRMGDTLWDISEAFYRNPRLYSFIVRTNGIRNPTLIVSGTELNIIPRY
ncbi:MAG: Hsp70 family protein [Treponema sp.]|nr:Hsp70 family protein [Treponema sp.]